MSRIFLFNKPYGVLTQFTDADGRATLADYIDIPGIYPAGRLDKNSEGLLLLTDDGKIQQQVADPRFKLTKTYWAQVEGVPDEQALMSLRTGVVLKDGMTRPAEVSLMKTEPDKLWPRDPPIRYRASIPDSWLELTIREGRNRQVRRMTAAAGYPTLRLIRCAIGRWSLNGLQPGDMRELPENEVSWFINNRGITN
ncbi:MAG TPA: pseudouridine synthase [Gammaproteobacteria bacterium]|nr:pseudouridine synthase [Gammaproteobacteria bacterium]